VSVASDGVGRSLSPSYCHDDSSLSLSRDLIDFRDDGDLSAPTSLAYPAIHCK